MIYGEINRQRLKIINEHVVADTIDYLEAQFAFSEDWDGLEKWVHFAKEGEVYDIRLTDNCVRKEDHLNLSAGIWKVYLHGNEFSGGKVIERITTNTAILKVEPTGVIDGEPFPEMPASVTEQILARLENVEQNGGGSGGGSGGGITKETDPTVPDWAKQPDPPKYTAADVGAATAQQFIDLSKAIADKADKPTYSGGNLQIGEDGIKTGIEWDYVDGMPEDNGLAFTGTAGTAVLQDDGVLLSAGAEYKFPVLTAKSATLECVFSIPSFATYQYGFRMQLTNGTTGIRISCYLNELRFNQNTNSNLAIAQLEIDTEYTLRIEWNETDGANVYLNGSQVLTNASTIYALDEIDIGQFHSGTTLLKSVSFQYDNVGAIEISSINGVELCDTKARANKANVSGWIPNKYIGTDAEGNLIEKNAIENLGGNVGTVSAIQSVLTDIVTFLKAVPFDDTVVSASDLDDIQSKIDALGSNNGTDEPEQPNEPDEPTETVSATFSGGELVISGVTVNSATFSDGVLAVA